MRRDELHPAPRIRDAAPSDFWRINEIYNWTIIDNHVSFDVDPWNEHDRSEWWESRSADLRCIVAEIDSRVVGLAYSSRYRPKPAYRSSMETTIVLDPDYRGLGLGSLLLGALIDRLVAQGVHMAIAIVALPNDASIALHHKLGYRTVGTITDAGFKGGRFHDTTILERRLV